MNNNQLLRYSRHIMLPQLDIIGQQKLLNASVCIIGVGGLGSPVALYLAAAGVGHLILSDDDYVELSNLQRQIIHSNQQINQSKVSSAKQHLHAINPDIVITTHDKRWSYTELLESIEKVDIVVDCTDNLTSRLAINKACYHYKIPLVSAAAERWEGQLSVYDSRLVDSPCYHCFYGEADETDKSCNTSGVVGPLLGVLGSMQAIEVIKLIANIGEPLIGRVLFYDALYVSWREMALPKHPQCQVCS